MNLGKIQEKFRKHLGKIIKDTLIGILFFNAISELSIRI